MRGATLYVDFKIPACDCWLGFDFEENRFVAPYGNGNSADVLLRFSLQETVLSQRVFDFCYNMKKFDEYIL